MLWIKLCTIDAVTLTGLRLAVAAGLLAPWAWRDWRRHRDRLNWSHLRDAAIPGLFLSAHLITWNFGVRQTLATNGTLIVNLTPLATPFLLAALMGERVTRREVAATALALVGLATLFAADFQLSPVTLRGDLVCFGSMLLLAVYLTLGRKYRHHPTTLLYVTPLYAVAAASAFLVSAFLGKAPSIDWAAEAPWVLLLAIVPTIFGHSLINQAMRHFRGQVVSLASMSQFVMAGLLAWAFLDETPHGTFYVAAAPIVVACVIALIGRRSGDEAPATPASTTEAG